MPTNLLINNEEDAIEIILYYRVKLSSSGFKQYKILTDEEGKKLIEKGDDSIDVLVTKWLPPTWQMNNNLLKQSMTYNKISGTNEFDITKYQENVFRYCIKAWDIVDDKGNEITPTPENIGQLPANIAQSLVRKYESSLRIDDEEKKE